VKTLSNHPRWKRVTCPALFLHGGADPRAHVEEARHVFDAVGGSKEFKEFPGVKHAAIVKRFPAEWKQTVDNFLKAHAILHPVALIGS
jgi:alpha-beta hydrolase superfamily lysophospholipase